MKLFDEYSDIFVDFFFRGTRTSISNITLSVEITHKRPLLLSNDGGHGPLIEMIEMGSCKRCLRPPYALIETPEECAPI